MKIDKIPPAVDALCQTLRRAGYAAYPVGGCVRDALLGRTPKDWDVTTAAHPQRVMELFPRTVPTGVKHGTVTVCTEDGPVEVTTFRRDGGYADGRHPDGVTFAGTLEEDLARRDFTINAMALTPEGEIVDPFGGRSDLTAGLIRCVGDPGLRFCEDGLRMLRAVRFSAQLGFALEENTEQALKANAAHAGSLSGERVKDELEKILLSPRPETAGMLISAGLLEGVWSQWRAGWQLEAEGVPATPVARWRWFCAATGFSIAALPVARAVRRGVLHPEAEVLKALALTGGELCALGLRGAEVGAMQRRLAAYVMAHPGENSRQRLREVAMQASETSETVEQ